jgi:UDP-3-O-[3-hydroxymyristoyl] glucosamine N-acyltransferase
MAGVVLIAPESIATLAERFGGSADAPALARTVARVVAPADAARDDDLVLLVARRALAAAQRARGIYLVSPALASEVSTERRWIHPHAMWAAARLLAQAAPSPAQPAIHPAAFVAPDAELGPKTRVGPFAVVLDGARVGSECEIGPGAVVYGAARLGDRVVVGAHAVIGRPGFGWTSGPDGQTLRVPQPGGVEIEDDVEIGPLATVDSGTLAPTRIRRGAKLDAHVHVGHNADIGPDSLVAAQAGFAGSVEIGAGAMIGGQSGFADHVRVGEGAKVAAKSGVIGDVPAGAVVAGFPAVPRVKWLRAMARLMTLALADRRR